MWTITEMFMLNCQILLKVQTEMRLLQILLLILPYKKRFCKFYKDEIDSLSVFTGEIY